VSTGHGSALKNRSPSGSADLTLPSSSIPQKINILLQLPFYSIAVLGLVNYWRAQRQGKAVIEARGFPRQKAGEPMSTYAGQKIYYSALKKSGVRYKAAFILRPVCNPTYHGNAA